MERAAAVVALETVVVLPVAALMVATREGEAMAVAALGAAMV